MTEYGSKEPSGALVEHPLLVLIQCNSLLSDEFIDLSLLCILISAEGLYIMDNFHRALYVIVTISDCVLK